MTSLLAAAAAGGAKNGSQSRHVPRAMERDEDLCVVRGARAVPEAEMQQLGEEEL